MFNEPKDHVDTSGVIALVLFSALLGFNQVVIKFTHEGLQPVFWASLRSLIALLVVAVWFKLAKSPLRFDRKYLKSGMLIGFVFSTEFLFLFLALDLTTVVRTSIIFYTMPVWLALFAHHFVPNERLTKVKALGLVLSVIGVTCAFLEREVDGSRASLIGDLCALAAAIFWAGIPLCTRLSDIKNERPAMQLAWQLLVSFPALLVASLFFGPWIREIQGVHYLGIGFQAVIVVGFGFVFWLRLLAVYPISIVASFSFLGPVFGVFLGWLILDEPVSLNTLGGLALVSVGIVLINRPPRRI